MKVQILLIVTIFFMAVQYGTGETYSSKSYPLFGNSRLALRVSSEWQVKTTLKEEEGVLDFYITPKKSSDFLIRVTAIWDSKNPSRFKDRDRVRAFVERSRDKILPRAVETQIKILDLNGSKSSGYYFKATDRSPKPGEWRYLAQGVATVGDLLVTFTILYNEKDSPLVRDALTMIREAQHVR